MSDVILHGVLNMPVDMWSDSPLDQIQRHARYIEASRRLRLLEGQVSLMGDFIRQHNQNPNSKLTLKENSEISRFLSDFSEESKQVLKETNEINFTLKPASSPDLFGPLDVVVASISDLDVVNVLAAVSGVGRHSKMECGDTELARDYLKSKITELASALSVSDIEDILEDVKQAERSERIA